MEICNTAKTKYLCYPPNQQTKLILYAQVVELVDTPA